MLASTYLTFRCAEHFSRRLDDLSISFLRFVSLLETCISYCKILRLAGLCTASSTFTTHTECLMGFWVEGEWGGGWVGGRERRWVKSQDISSLSLSLSAHSMVWTRCSRKPTLHTHSPLSRWENLPPAQSSPVKSIITVRRKKSSKSMSGQWERRWKRGSANERTDTGGCRRPGPMRGGPGAGRDQWEGRRYHDVAVAPCWQTVCVGKRDHVQPLATGGSVIPSPPVDYRWEK